mmetsp:Transcript_5523/g.4721  ORF Transcript_5523/g.4721 Transcript_5523/m.4721 type:complete len:94 (-) Transcript_5523:44-325(-)
MLPSEEDYVETHFNYPGKPTDKVYIVGSFNNWNKRDNRMSYNHRTKNFHCCDLLLPGKYLFKIFVNGKWILDPHKPKESNKNGEEVSVLIVEA